MINFALQKLQTQKKYPLSVFQIKMIALICMTLDHIGKEFFFLLPPVLSFLLQMIGRLAAPLFLFAIVEGLWHTRSKLKYALRMYLASVCMFLAHIAASLLPLNRPDVLGFVYPDNIFLTWFWIILLAYAMDSIRDFWSGKQPKSLLPLLCITLYAALSATLGALFPDSTLLFMLFPFPSLELAYWYFIPLGCVMYGLRSKERSCCAFGAFSLAFLVGTIFQLLFKRNFWGVLFFSENQWMMLFALPVMLLCNEHRGRPMKAFFYAYYILHCFAFYLIGILLYTLLS